MTIQSITAVTARRNLRNNNDYSNSNSNNNDYSNVDSITSPSPPASYTSLAGLGAGLGLGLGQWGITMQAASKISVKYTITVTAPHPPLAATLVTR